MSSKIVKKRSRLDGLYFSRKHEKKRGDPPLETRECYVKELALNSGDVNKEGVLEFELKLGLNEWGRFQPAPFLAEYYFFIKNPSYTEPPAGGNLVKDPPTVMTRSDKTTEPDYLYLKNPVLHVDGMQKNTGLYLPPEQGIAALFSHVEVFVNGMKVGDDTDMMNQNKAYQALNRIYSTKLQRTRVNQHVVDLNDVMSMTPTKETRTREDDSKPWRYKNVKYLSDSQKALSRSMNNECYTVQTPLSNRFTMDGNFAVSPPFCNALATLRQQEHLNTCGFFPPGTVITVRLHPRYPRFSLVQVFNNGWKKQISLASLPADKQTRPQGLSIQFTKFVMSYESIILSDDLSRRQMSRTLNYPFQRVQTDLCSFEPLHQQVVLKSRVPAGAKCAFIAFMREEHLWYNNDANKNMSNYFHFPNNLSRIGLHLTNHGPLLSKTGLSGLNKLDRHYSFSLSSYYENYVSGRGITDISFDEMFPNFTEAFVLDKNSKVQSLFVDMQQYYIKDPTQLTVSLDFQGTRMSPSQTKLLVVYVMDMNLRRTSDGRWTLESVI